ncbi:MAG: bifunctional methylenetetrahydrofolate dehydrogenase/methenyltetrahydrofolate cyclohydrolase FolD [Candidatus Wallbacteria bacterium]|nr:bifunctional methylenetetrahydrofolate dehydrogenase/methenyltetrahydrofolate cyclohydrolase FolD [Candidatus Wallbacteria bacterium]
MSAQLLDGKAVAAQENERTRERVRALLERGVVPGLATVLVGDNPASHVYVANKRKTCKKLGIASVDADLPADASEETLLETVRRLNEDPRVHGLLVQMPLPKHIDEHRVLEAVDPQKDVDGFHPRNVGLLALGRPWMIPCTTMGILRLLERAEVGIAGKNAVIIGRSNIVGKPTALLLLSLHATVTLCHTRTRDLPGLVSRSELVVAAMGKAEAIRGDWIAPGAVVIDVGINRVGEKLVGDVEFASARERASLITPVPGGVGPMTIAMLMENTVTLAERVAGGLS